MFSIADMAVAGAVALLLFGPDQLPKVARRAGQLVRDVQNTSQSFIREMERAADAHDDVAAGAADRSPASRLPAAPLYHETPEPAPHEVVAREAALDPHATGVASSNLAGSSTSGAQTTLAEPDSASAAPSVAAERAESTLPSAHESPHSAAGEVAP